MKFPGTSLFLFVMLTAASHTTSAISPADTGALSFSFRNYNFVKDNEYSNPITEGYTLIGYFIQPSVVYSPAEKFRLSLGLQLMNYSGAEKIRAPRLIFSTSYRFSKRSVILLGSFEGSDRHRMYDQQFSRERTYTANMENGLRVYSEGERFFNDTWVNWENFIFRGDTTREVFEVGESFCYSSPHSGSGFNIELPVQVYAKHKGGQISNYNQYVETFLNMSAGLRVNYLFDNGRYGRLAGEYQQFRFQYISPHGDIGIRNGNAGLLAIHYYIRSFHYTSSLWHSHNFYAPDGNQFYSSISERFPGTFIHSRSILTNSVYFTIHPASFFELFAGVDTYWDLEREDLDIALSLHLAFNRFIRIASTH